MILTNTYYFNFFNIFFLLVSNILICFVIITQQINIFFLLVSNILICFVIITQQINIFFLLVSNILICILNISFYIYQIYFHL
jgi:hypothetical protein